MKFKRLIKRIIYEQYLFFIYLNYKLKIKKNGLYMKDKFNLVETKIKEFKLPNSRGETYSIRDFLGQNVVIILFRSKT